MVKGISVKFLWDFKNSVTVPPGINSASIFIEKAEKDITIFDVNITNHSDLADRLNVNKKSGKFSNLVHFRHPIAFS